MKFLLYLSDFIVPFVIFYIVGFGILMKTNVYEHFIKGARKGFFTVIKIMPTLIGLMEVVSRFVVHIGFPVQLVPLTIVRMFSSSAATGLVLDIFKEYGTDSYIGLVASIMMSCTETIFYTMSVYFMTANIKKTRYTLAGALLATFAGIAVSVLLASGMYAG